MNLTAHWRNATRLQDEKAVREAAYRDYLVDHFGTVDEAFKAKEDFHRQHENPKHEWAIAEMKARYVALRGLPPCEAKGVCLTLEWRL